MDRLKVLVVDDESRMRKLVRDFLVKSNFDVLQAGDGEEALDIFYKEKDIALIILDVMMPKMDGWQVCREIRVNSKVPIIMLTARGDERDELQGFQLGVDEYISKPFSPKILVARVEAILRRTNQLGQEEALTCGGITVDKAAHRVIIDGKDVDLSYKEFELLTYFMENKGIALSREKILNNVWNYDYFGDARTIDTHVKKLRSKLGEEGNLIKTIWAWGTRWMKQRNKQQKRKVHSIRGQFAWIFIGLMIGTILLCLMINYLFLGKVYMQSKLDVIHDAYGTIKQAAESDSYDTEEFARELDDVCRSYNMTVCVMDVNSNMKYVSINGGERLENRLIGYVFGLSIPFNDQRVIENGDDYVIQRTGQEDKEYLEIYGRLNTGISFIMQTPLSSIQESAKIANRFYALAGCLGAMAGGIIIWFVSRSVTKPILELNNISERMVQLDFEAKYQGKAHNEIDLLGENINKLSDSLEKTISELKTANNELQRDVEKKEAIDEMRKEFLANVSHELKTPIALIQGYAEGLQEEINDDPESRQFYCDVIVDEAAKMNNMVKKLLTLNQLEFGNDVVAMERFDLTALVKNYIQSAAILTKQHEITVRMEEYPPIYAWADEFKIEEVFMNFFSNAVNHCEDDKIIEVKMEQKDGKVRVSVFNTGKPIPEDSIHHIWEKFYKVDKARTREYGGSGVGLSIVKAIMESMNQQFGVNNYNNGVEFWFELETK